MQDPIIQLVIASPSLLPAATHSASTLVPSTTDGLNILAPPSVNLKPAKFSLRTGSSSADRSGNVCDKY